MYMYMYGSTVPFIFCSRMERLYCDACTVQENEVHQAENYADKAIALDKYNPHGTHMDR